MPGQKCSNDFSKFSQNKFILSSAVLPGPCFQMVRLILKNFFLSLSITYFFNMVFKTRLFCFTNFDLIFDYKNLIDSSSCEYIIYGDEICPHTKKPHHQGFCYFSGALTCHKNKKGKMFSKRVAKLLNNCHHEACSGNLDQNCNYCIKDDNVHEFGKEPKQGHRTDLDAIKESILEQKLTVEDICAEHPTIYHQYGRTLNKLEDMALRKRFRTWMTKGFWYHGSTGTGKSHTAFHEHTSYPLPGDWYLWPKDGSWWDGYKGESVVIINEFRGSCHLSYDELLDLTDKWPKYVSRRNREPVPFLAKKIIITSPDEPEICYLNGGELDDCEQLLRRFEVIHLEQKWSTGNTNDSVD